MYGAVANDDSVEITTTAATTTAYRKESNKFTYFLMGAFGGLVVALAASHFYQNENEPFHPTPSSSTGSLMKPSLSQRGASLGLVREDLPLFAKATEDAFDPQLNPQGYLVMLVAENKLMWKEMAKKIEDTQAARPIPQWIFNYGAMTGEVSFKQAMAKTMQHWIKAPVNPDNLQFQDGAGSMLSQISFILTDPGDAVLTAAPGYMAFAIDFKIYAGANIQWIHSDAENGYVPTVEQLDQGYSKAVEAGNRPRIFVICQPQNPTGVIFSKEDMSTMIDWALSRQLHIVSDEIYALSTFPGYHTISAADIMHEKYPNRTDFMGEYVHVIAGLSKDWGMSGFRIGSLFSHNVDVLAALDAIGYYHSPSRYTQFALQGIFDDDEFVRWYISENRKRLHETYQALGTALSLIDVPLLPSHGGIFGWADFSAYILEGQTEYDLWIELFDKAKIALTSGKSCEANKPGLFRIVYGWPEGGVYAMEELGRRLVSWKAAREATDHIYLAVDHPLKDILAS